MLWCRATIQPPADCTGNPLCHIALLKLISNCQQLNKGSQESTISENGRMNNIHICVMWAWLQVLLYMWWITAYRCIFTKGGDPQYPYHCEYNHVKGGQWVQLLAYHQFPVLHVNMTATQHTAKVNHCIQVYNFTSVSAPSISRLTMGLTAGLLSDSSVRQSNMTSLNPFSLNLQYWSWKSSHSVFVLQSWYNRCHTRNGSIQNHS